MEGNGGPQISDFELWLGVAVLLVIDLVQILLDLVAIGIVLNEFIDIFVGLAYPFYLKMRGVELMQPKRLFSLLAVFGLELVPVLNALPLWCLDGIYNMILIKREKKEAQKAEKNQILMLKNNPALLSQRKKI